MSIFDLTESRFETATLKIFTTTFVDFSYYCQSTCRGFGMRQQAVELALKVDPSLARELAQDSVELEERKRLWLMIAKNAASEGVSGGDVDVVSKVVSVLKDCGPDVLSIEDVRESSLEFAVALYIPFAEHKLFLNPIFSLHRFSLFFQILPRSIKSRTRFVKLLHPTPPKSKDS